MCVGCFAEAENWLANYKRITAERTNPALLPGRIEPVIENPKMILPTRGSVRERFGSQVRMVIPAQLATDGNRYDSVERLRGNGRVRCSLPGQQWRTGSLINRLAAVHELTDISRLTFRVTSRVFLGSVTGHVPRIYYSPLR